MNPLVKVQFDEFSDRLNEASPNLYKYHNSRLSEVLGFGQDAIKSSKLAKSHFEIIFTKKTMAALRKGDLKLPIDKKTGIFRLDARNPKGQLKEFGQIKQASTVTKLANVVVSLAHIISSIDTQIKLENIDRKIDGIINFLHQDRLGELRGIYGAFQKALTLADESRKKDILYSLSSDLDVLSGRFFQTMQSRFEAIEDPSNIGGFTSIFSLQSTAEEKLSNELSQAVGEARTIDLIRMVNIHILSELDEGQSIQAVIEKDSKQFIKLKPLMLEKSEYYSFDLQNNLSSQISDRQSPRQIKLVS